ncbi:MAG: SDR family oxidoreductase, partial [Myxococcales bacterium]
TMLVTCATDGIGRQTALELVRRGARVLVHGRDPEKTARTAEALAKDGRAEPLVADLASLAQVRQLAREVEGRTGQLDVLLNNAGVFMNERRLTADGFETTFAVNHLAPFLLTNLLRPLLERTPGARVVTVSSVAHHRGQLDFGNLQGERRFDGYGAYALSKLANVLFTLELAERLAGSGVTANCLHPGVITTKLLKAGFGMSGAPVASGAATSVYLATSDEVRGVSGKYFADCQEAPLAPAAGDADARRRLWDESARLVGLA